MLSKGWAESVDWDEQRESQHWVWDYAMLHPSLQLMWDRSFCLCMMICYVRMIHNDGEDKNMTDGELKALVADLSP